MKTIIQLLLIALVLHGLFQVGWSAWRYYALKDAMQSEAMHGAAATTTELRRRIIAIAADSEAYLEARNVVIARNGDLTTIDFAYEEEIPLAPFYSHPWTFEVSASARRVKPIRIDDIR